MAELKLEVSIKDLEIIDDLKNKVESQIKNTEVELQFLRGLHDYISQYGLGENMIENYKDIYVSDGGILPEDYQWI